MRGFVAVLRREVFERRLLGLLALALGLIAALLPLVPGIRPGGVTLADLQGGLALGMALLLTAILAVFLGSSMIAGDLAERRLGFYFSRPLPGWAIWAGKMAAALVLIFGGAILVLAPAVLVGGNLNLEGIWGVGNVISVTGGSLIAAWATFLLLVLTAVHAVSVIVRARSPWALLDLAALAVVAGLVWGTLRRMKLEGILPRLTFPAWMDRPGIGAWMELGLLAAILLALVLAGALQVVRGRTDLRRAHRVLSQGLWGMLLAAVLLFVGFTAWVLAVGPGDLLGFSGVAAAPGSRWLAFDGPAARRPGYNPSFLYDLDSGRVVHARFGLLPSFKAFDRIGTPTVGFSADGRRAVWLEYDGVTFDSPVTAFRMDLDRPGSQPVRTPISFRYAPSGFALSPDGRRIAAYEWEGRLTVVSLDDGRLVAAARYESTSVSPRLVFAGPDRLRIYEIQSADANPFLRVGAPSTIFELDLTASAPHPLKTGEIPPMAGGIRDWSLSPAGDRLLARSVDALGLCDARTGMPLAVLGSGHARGTFLRDGRIAVMEAVRGRYEHELRIFPPDGHSEPRRFPFANVLGATVADQPAPGVLRVVTSRPGAPRELWQVDLEPGTIRRMGTLRLASLDLPQVARSRVDLKDVDGVVWYEPWSARTRVVLKRPAAPAVAPPR
ncbi:MAG: hypothetical protein DMF53_26270 [Acidobacteria bacterium]|nr:MAG: hypothetical protein DMF53_26270 [Acidobacteriota bacterium]